MPPVRLLRPSLLATFIAAAESICSRIDDNIRFSLAASGGMLLSQTILLGM